MSTEDTWKAAHYLHEAADKAIRAANNLEDAQRKLTHLFEPGYGSSVFDLLELLQDGGKVDKLLSLLPEKVELLNAGEPVEYPSGKGVLVVSEPDANGCVIVKDVTGDYRRITNVAVRKLQN